MKLKNIIFFVSIITSLSFAQDNLKVKTGLGIFYSSSVYKQADDTVILFPALHVKYKNFYVSGLDTGYVLYEDKKLKISTELSIGDLGYKSSDSTYLQNMDKRKQDIQTKLKLSYMLNQDFVEVFYAHDFFNTHKGFEFDLYYTKNLYRTNYQNIDASFGLQYLSNDKSNCYFGVKNSEVIGDRKAYVLKETINPYTKIHYTYKFDERWSLHANVKYKLLDKEIQNSPIVEKKYNLSSFIGVIYEW